MNIKHLFTVERERERERESEREGSFSPEVTMHPALYSLVDLELYVFIVSESECFWNQVPPVHVILSIMI